MLKEEDENERRPLVDFANDHGGGGGGGVGASRSGNNNSNSKKNSSNSSSRARATRGEERDRRKLPPTTSSSSSGSSEDDDDADNETSRLLGVEGDGSEEEEEEEQRLPAIQVIGVSCGGCIIEWSWAVEDTALLPLMMKRGISPQIGALIYLPVSLVTLAVAPFMGRASDRCTSRLGRRRPFIIVLAAMIVVGLSAILTEPEIAVWLEPLMGAEGAAIFVFFLLAVISDTGTCLLLGPTRALVGDILPPKQLVEVNGQYGAYLVFARTFALAVGAMPLDKAAAALGFDWVQEEVFIFFALILIVLCTLLACIAGREKQYVRNIYAPVSPLSINNPEEYSAEYNAEHESMWKKLRGVPRRVVIFLLMQLCAQIVVIAQAWFWTVYVSPDVVFDGTNIHVAFVGLCAQSVVAFVLGALVPRISEKFGDMNTYMAMMSVFCVLLAVCYLDMHPILICGVVSFMGCGFCVTDGTMYVMMENETADCAETDRGFYMSLLANSLSVAVCIVSPLSAVVLTFMDGQIDLMYLCSGIFGLASLWMLWVVDWWFCRRHSNKPSGDAANKSIDIRDVLASQQ